jgi:DNA-binding FadR family transcriptional regulator
LLLVLEKYEKDYLDISDRTLSLQQHTRIYDAIKEKDPGKARLAMKVHMETMESRLKKMEIQE